MSLLLAAESVKQFGPEAPLERCPALTKTMLEHRMADPDYHSEEWRPIQDFPGYEVSNLGRVRNANWRGIGPRMLRPGRGSKGYLHVSLFGDQGPKQFKVSRLVCAAFHGEPSPGVHAAHNDGDVSNNVASNLRWATPTENAGDRAVHGTQCRGEEHGKAKLTSELVREIRNSSESGASIARRLGLQKTTISAIRRGLTWKHL